MSKKKKPSFKFLTHVDDEHNIVYVQSAGWAGSMARQANVRQYYPDHEVKIASQDLIEYLNGEGQ